MNREPSIVTVPLDFTGLRDNRLAVMSQRGFSWTDTQYNIQGMDATDSYQPGFPNVFPDVQALDEAVVHDACGRAEVGVFLREPSESCHGVLSTGYTGRALSWDNLPPPPARGLVRQPDRVDWLTRDRFEAARPPDRHFRRWTASDPAAPLAAV